MGVGSLATGTRTTTRAESGSGLAVRTDDPAAVEAAFVRYYADLQRYALFLWAGVDAEDVVQDAFVRLTRRSRTVDDVGAYLRTTVRNLVYDRSGPALRLRSVAEVPAGADGRAAVAFDSVELADLWAALDDLSPQQRNCAVLAFFWGLGNSEIATELGCRRSTVRNHLARAVERLGRQWEEAR